jgi:hypothetical protein
LGEDTLLVVAGAAMPVVVRLRPNPGNRPVSAPGRPLGGESSPQCDDLADLELLWSLPPGNPSLTG